MHGDFTVQSSAQIQIQTKIHVQIQIQMQIQQERARDVKALKGERCSDVVDDDLGDDDVYGVADVADDVVVLWHCSTAWLKGML